MAFAVVVWLNDVSESGYGMRYGFWRLLAAIEKHRLRATLVASPALLLRCPEIVTAVQHHSWEIAMHLDEPSTLSSSQLLSRCSALARAFQEAVSEGPKGFYLSGPHSSIHLRTEILNHLGLRYDARGEGDLPWRSPHLVVPSSPLLSRRDGQPWEPGRARACAEDRAAVLGNSLSALLAEGEEGASQVKLMQSYATSAVALGRERDGGGGGGSQRDESRTSHSHCRPKMLVLDLSCGVDGLPGVCDVWDTRLRQVSELGARGRVWLATKVCKLSI